MLFRRPKRWNLAKKWWTSYGVLFVDPFPIETLHQFMRNWILAQKKWAPKLKFLKNAVSEAETIEFSWETKILLGSPSHWPISDRKFALICLKLNSGTKKQRPPKQKFWKKMLFRRLKRWNLAENDEPHTESYLLTHFQSKSCTNLSETEFWHKKNEHQNEKF